MFHVTTPVPVFFEPSMFCLVLTSKSAQLCYLRPGIWSVITGVMSRCSPLSQELCILLGHCSVILQSLHQNLKPGKVANFSILKQTQYHLLQVTPHEEGDVYIYPEVLPEWQLSILLHTVHVLGHHYMLYKTFESLFTLTSGHWSFNFQTFSRLLRPACFDINIVRGGLLSDFAGFLSIHSFLGWRQGPVSAHDIDAGSRCPRPLGNWVRSLLPAPADWLIVKVFPNPRTRLKSVQAVLAMLGSHIYSIIPGIPHTHPSLVRINTLNYMIQLLLWLD